MRIQFVLMVLAVALVSADTMGASPVSMAIDGAWTLNVKASDSVDEKFKHFRKTRRGGFRDGGIGAGKGGKMGGQHGEAADDGAERRAGTIRDIVGAEQLDIAGRESVSIDYNGIITRELSPNPHGRVYSASGAELVTDRFGHTLSFWQGNTLVVETTTRRGLDVIERFRIDRDSGRLVVDIKVTPSGEFGVEFSRVFDRSAAGS